jgi:ferredoxin-NADP reductase
LSTAAFELRVRSVRRATPSSRIVSVELDGAPFQYRAGQLAMIGLARDDARVPYSIASAPEESRRNGILEFLTRADPDSRLRAAKRGARLFVEGPLGSFTLPPKPPERHFLFVAGGSGIAPLRSMIREAILTRQPGRMSLLYSARSPVEFAYLRELRGLALEGKLRLALTATREVPPRWRGDRGRITRDRLEPLVETPETLCFVCGPAAMVDDVPMMLREMGIDRKRIKVEEWS